MKKKGNPDQYGQLESLNNCSKKRTIKFEVLNWEFLKRIPLKRPVNRLYSLERMKDTVTKIGNELIKITYARSRTEAAILGKIKQKINTWAIGSHFILGGSV